MADDNFDPAAANAPIDKDAPNGSKATRDWMGRIVLALAIFALLWGVIAPIGSGIGLWGWQSGLKGLGYSAILAFITFLIVVLLLWRGGKSGKKGSKLLRWGALAISLGYSLWMANVIMDAKSHPAIHDVSTDLADPPAFKVLKLREDNWDNIPGAEDEDMRGLSPQQRWRALHQESYSDVRTVRVGLPLPDVMAKAERLAEDRGWDIAVNLPAEGRLEATATTSLFRFKDDIVLRVRPTANGAESIIDMRSVSRVGTGDVGVNAKRVRAFLADLEGTVSSAR